MNTVTAIKNPKFDEKSTLKNTSWTQHRVTTFLTVGANCQCFRVPLLPNNFLIKGVTRMKEVPVYTKDFEPSLDLDINLNR